jgi:hypothetical protein
VKTYHCLARRQRVITVISRHEDARNLAYAVQFSVSLGGCERRPDRSPGLTTRDFGEVIGPARASSSFSEGQPLPKLDGSRFLFSSGGMGG